MRPHCFATFGGLRSRVNDLDSHVELPHSNWAQELGGPWASVATAVQSTPEVDGRRATVLDPESFWTVKDTRAPGTFGLDDRLQILDAVGIDHQLVFPALLMLMKMWSPAADPDGAHVRAYNEFAARWTRQSAGRVRVAATVSGGLAAAVAQVERALAEGVRAVLLRDGVPLDGRSPADPAMDPLWAMVEAAHATVALHVAGHRGFASDAWKATPALDVDPTAGDLGDRLAGPYELGTMHLSPSNYLTAMILGGVFDRHPGLRVGVIEYGAMWAAPLADFLSNRWGQSARTRAWQRTPREVFAENLRFTAFGFEPVARQIDRYGLAEIYAFATDFPHPEGGTNPHELLFDDLEALGPATLEGFFVTNARLLLAE